MRIFGSNHGDKKIRTTRFAIVNSGTSGTVTLPANATVILDDFGADGVGGLLDAVVSKVTSSYPDYRQALDAGSLAVATTFNSNGDYTLSAAPSAYPIAIIYRVYQDLAMFDSDSSNIIGVPTLINGTVANVPGGSNTYVQFNDSGSFGGDAGFTYNKTTDIATLGGLNLTGLTASQITATDASKNLQSLSTGTYPSLTELSYVKGVTSAIQTQLASKATTQQTDFISGYIETAVDGTIIAVIKIPYAITITSITTKCVAGSCTLTGQIDGVNLGGTANAVSTAEREETHSSANSASVGNDIQVRISSNSGCTGLSFTIKFTRSLS